MDFNKIFKTFIFHKTAKKKIKTQIGRNIGKEYVSQKT